MTNAQSYQFDAVIMTTAATGTPHAEALKASNPGLSVHVCESTHGSTEPERLDRWRNCDRNIREWWRANRDDCASGHFLFLEWDVFCDVDLREFIRPAAGLCAASILSGLTDVRRFWPFEDAPKLPRSMQALACAAAPLAVLLISRAALDSILSPEYDAVFASDIFCEVRLPTVIRHAGHGVAELDMPHVTATPTLPTSPGIWHPVKHSSP